MPLINLILNLLWLVSGGIVVGAAWMVATLLFAVSIVGLPWARAAFNIALFTLWPFGKVAVDRRLLSGPDLGTGAVGQLGNLIWLIVAGWWLGIGHVLAAAALACTVIGVPFAWQHLKLAMLAFWPIGMSVVPAGSVARYR